nr:unnamed protein product [Spirometra erinaceieuropaei]
MSSRSQLPRTPRRQLEITALLNPPLSSFIASTSVAASPASTIAHNLHTPVNINLIIGKTQDSVQTCPHCDRAFASHIGLVGDLRIHRTEAGESVPGVATYTRRICSHCHRKFTHCMGLLHHMRIREIGSHRGHDTPGISCTSAMPSPTHIPLSSVLNIGISTTIAITETDPETDDLSCPHYPRTFTSRIGPVGRLRIHRTDWRASA